MKYNPRALEKKWQKIWEKERIYEPDLDRAKKPFYNLMMFPYPSAEGLHVGNVFTFAGVDVHGRFKRLQGYDVFEPIGLDGFGIHSENYALKVGRHPATQAKISEKNFYRQLSNIGNGFAWDERLETYNPEFYHWTQWIFVQMFKKGLAYRKAQEVNWCPSCMTVLADEQVEGGKCERCSTVVIKKNLEQWFFKITDYADRLLNDLEDLDWAEKIKIAQRNWIGRSEGATLDFPLDQKTNYVFLHGILASPKINFWPWLKNELEKQGHQIEAPQLPNPASIELETKVEHVLKNCKFTKDTVIVAHSLGCMVALKLLKKLKTPIKKVVLVAPPSPSLNRLPKKERDRFWGGISASSLKKKASKFIVVIDERDKVVLPRESLEIARELQAEVIRDTPPLTHFVGRESQSVLKAARQSLEVFTTRPDTIFGATYMVIAPEHPLIKQEVDNIKNKAEVEKYLKAVSKKTDDERIAEGKEKTGVELKGIKAINPATGKPIPIWVADYVLGGYGTGAIMAVPAHDKRDSEFARKYKLPITTVIEPVTGEKQKGEVHRQSILAVVRNPRNGKLLSIKWRVGPKEHKNLFIGGGLEKGENPEACAIREIKEETGYKNLKLIAMSEPVHHHYYAHSKGIARSIDAVGLYFELVNEEQQDQKLSPEEKGKFEVEWITEKQAEEISEPLHGYLFRKFVKGEVYTSSGFLMNSGDFSGMDSGKAKLEILKKIGGKMETRFRLRDWLISRQRYWGPPIPMIHCDSCAEAGKGERSEMPGWYAVPEKDLPVKLPIIKDFRPRGKGKSPLASSPSFVKVRCPGCKSWATRETDVSDTFLDSAWYYFRYLDPKNKKSALNAKRVKKWLPVHAYIGGAEHAVLHLLYVRFLAKAFYDWKLINFQEPATKFRANGLLTRDGAKISKSKGNLIVPDDFIEQFGIDAFRMHLMFIGPFEEGGDFRDTGILGQERFLKEIWGYFEYRQENAKKTDTKDPEYQKIRKALHKAIKKTEEEYEKLKYNTVIAELMSIRNLLSVSEVKQGRKDSVLLTDEDAGIFLKMLAPLAPFIAEEIWREFLGNKTSIHNSPWPKYNPELLKDDTHILIVQINGRVRDNLEVPAGTSEDEAKKLAQESPRTQSYLKNVKIKKVIFVKGRLINFVVE